MHKWLQLPATPTDDPLATVYPVNNHYKKSHVYAVTRINPIYVDDEQHGTWDKSGSSGYYSQPHSDRSSVDKRSPPAVKCLRAGTPPPSDGSSGGSSAAAQRNAAAPWLSPIKEGVIDVHQFCIPRPVWPGRDDDAPRRKTTAGAAPRLNGCRHCARCRCRDHYGGRAIDGSTTNTSASTSSGDSGAGSLVGKLVAVGSYSGYTSSAYGGTVSTGTGSCSDDAVPSSGTASVKSDRSPLAVSSHPRFDRTCSPMMDNNWYSVDPTLNQKTDNLQHYDCGAMLRGLQFTLDSQQAEKLMEKIKVGKKQRCWCRLVTACLGLIMFLVSVVTVSLALTRGQKMFGSL